MRLAISPPPRFVVALVSVVGLVVGGCSSDPGFDREAAVAELLETYPGAMSAAQAGCYVDRVVAELGAAQLEPDAEPDDAQIRRLTAIRVDCVGVAALGQATTTAVAPPAEGAPAETEPGPWTLGDDPVLDELWIACEGGSGAACDELFEVAPLSSDYERFGATCGGRGAEPVCAAVYPG